MSIWHLHWSMVPLRVFLPIWKQFSLKPAKAICTRPSWLLRRETSFGGLIVPELQSSRHAHELHQAKSSRVIAWEICNGWLAITCIDWVDQDAIVVYCAFCLRSTSHNWHEYKKTRQRRASLRSLARVSLFPVLGDSLLLTYKSFHSKLNKPLASGLNLNWHSDSFVGRLVGDELCILQGSLTQLLSRGSIDNKEWFVVKFQRTNHGVFGHLSLASTWLAL